MFMYILIDLIQDNLNQVKVIRTLDLASVEIDLRTEVKGNFASIMSCIYAELAIITISQEEINTNIKLYLLNQL